MAEPELREQRWEAVAIGVAILLVVVLCLVVWPRGKQLGTLPTLYLTVLSLSVGLGAWWTIRFQTSGLPGVGRYAAMAWVGVLLDLGIVLGVALHDGAPPPPTRAQEDSELFGVTTNRLLLLPVEKLPHTPTPADADQVPPLRTLGIGTSEPPPATGPMVPVPVQKMHVTGSGVLLLVHANFTCRLRGVLVGPAEQAGGVAVIALAEPTEPPGAPLAGRNGSCAPDGAVGTYTTVDVTWPGQPVTQVLDVGAGGPATPT